MKHLCGYLHRLGNALFLHLPALKRRQISALPELGGGGGVGDVTRRCGYLPGGTKVLVAVCTVCCCSTCEALSPQVVVDRVPSYARGPGGKITEGSIVFQSGGGLVFQASLSDYRLVADKFVTSHGIR